PDAASDLRDTYHRGFGETDERVRQDRETGRADCRGDVPRLAGQIKVGKVEFRVRALECYDTQARAGIHSSEQVLEALEYGVVYNVERRIIEHNPPVCSRFLDDSHGRHRFSHDSRSLFRSRPAPLTCSLRLGEPRASCPSGDRASPSN